ncbi:MAG: Alanine racemase [Parcubacteria group bacterium GW2011_GWB1_52_7]|nr:MAG: Alanine racemase [Parcubacteria group bacterium GW2011_GWB1_52_7]
MPKPHPKNFVRTWIEIDRRSLFFNLSKFQKLAGKASIMAIVKSNAYGHGLALIAKCLTTKDKRLLALRSFSEGGWFGVDSVTEALRLRREGISNPILVLGYTLPMRLAEAAKNNIAVTASHFEALANLARAKKRPQLHIKIDTSMHRQGFQEDDLPRLIRELRKEHLMPEGVYSHLASAENKQFSKKQIAAFTRALNFMRSAGVALKHVHIASTGGIMRYRLPFANLVRLGLGLYGYLPDRRVGIVRPVLTWKTIIGEVKRVKKGEHIGYDMTERLKRDSTIAILPIGYWHGFDRGLSKIGEVLIHGKRCRVLGRVSMDMAVVDVTDIDRKLKIKNEKVKIGDEVVLIGRQGREFIGADEMAKRIGTISYEVLTRINPLIFRTVI